MIEIHDITNSVFASKTYILSKEGEDKAWLVDIGDFEPVRSYFQVHDLVPAGVFITHAHFDHIYGLEALTECYPDCLVYVCEYAKQALASSKLNLSKYQGTPINFESDHVVVVREGDSMALYEGEPQMEFYETPGHNPGCLTMVLGDVVFTGDAYIPGIGVTTRLPHSDKELSKLSMERILELSKGRRVFSGHQTEQ